MSKKKAKPKNLKGNAKIATVSHLTRGNRAPWNSKERADLVAQLNDPSVLLDNKGNPVGISMRQKAVETIGEALQIRDNKGNPTQLAFDAAALVLEKTDPNTKGGGGSFGVQIIIEQYDGPPARLAAATIPAPSQAISVHPIDQR